MHSTYVDAKHVLTFLLDQMQTTQLTHLSNEAGVYLGRAGGQEGGDLKEFAEVLTLYNI